MKVVHTQPCDVFRRSSYLKRKRLVWKLYAKAAFNFQSATKRINAFQWTTLDMYITYQKRL